jgi:hypothetical protein
MLIEGYITMTLTILKKPHDINIIPESKYTDNPYCLALLKLFTNHPRTRFSRLVLVHALCNSKPYIINRALKRLVNDGVIVLHSDKIIPLYSLAEEET